MSNFLPEELTDTNLRVTVNNVYEQQVRGRTAQTAQATLGHGTTVLEPKSLDDFYDLVRRAIIHYEDRAGTPEVNRIIFTEEEPDVQSLTETIAFSLINRVPGQFSQGPPMSRNHVNLLPRFRDEYPDPTNPGYRCVVNGYYHDNIVRFTCWAKTNKQANLRAAWFEKMMNEYTWWFKIQGIDRVLYQGRRADISLKRDKNRWYGRPIDFFVRTETLQLFQEKTLEEILVTLSTQK